MLNMKKGLAVALAAVTALTFAPTSAFAGTTVDTTYGASSKSTLTSTMNETANVWSYSDNRATGETVTEKGLNDEQGAVVVLTPSNPEGSVTFTKEITDSEELKDGQWYNVTSTGSAAQTGDANKEAGSVLQLTAGKKSKTLKIKASVSKLRELNTPEKITIVSGSTYTTANELDTPILTANTKVTVILANHAVKMNNLKVTLSTASDSAKDRYLTHGSDVYDSLEARPTGDLTSSGTATDIKTKDDVDVALDGTRISDSKVSPIEMNLAGSSKDKAFTVESNADVTYKSDDTSVATIDKDGIHAKAVGDTNVTISTKQSLTAYGEVTVTIPVHVINKPSATLSAPDDLYVYGSGKTNAVKIGATGTNIQKNSIKYDFVYWDALTQSYVSFRDSSPYNRSSYLNPFRMDEASDTVYVEDYTGIDDTRIQWNSYLKVTAKAADGYVGPDAKYIKLHFSKDENAFSLDSYSQELHIGESVQITTKSVTAVTGAAFTYKSYNTGVASVSDTGLIKAVGEGTTQIDVKYGNTTRSVTVTVKPYENGKGSTTTASKPAKVTGVKVTNKKGGFVTVTWDKQDQENIKYYVKKTVNGKSAGKSVNGGKTTLTVKKGATVKVKVKAYVYDATGKKLVGTYSKTVTKKTDKK